MSKTIWRVEWTVHKGPRTHTDFTNEKKAMEWAEGIHNSGAGRADVVVTELIVGRIVKFNTDSPLFQK